MSFGWDFRLAVYSLFVELCDFVQDLVAVKTRLHPVENEMSMLLNEAQRLPEDKERVLKMM